jgi:hypothetical protein
MLAVPCKTPVTNPAEETVATVGAEEDHVAVEVTSVVLPSLLVAMALSCVVPVSAT